MHDALAFINILLDEKRNDMRHRKGMAEGRLSEENRGLGPASVLMEGSLTVEAYVWGE